MPNDPIALAQASYARCREIPKFFASFYADLFARCPAAQPMFADTDFERQFRLIDHGIGLLINFNYQAEGEPNILSRLAEKHSRGRLEVNPVLYASFIATLVAMARKFDPEFTEETEEAYRLATFKGIAYMASKF